MTPQLHDAIERLSEVYEGSREVAGDVADRAKHLYDDARHWVPEHYGLVAAISSAAFGMYLLGYLSGRGSRPEPSARETAREVAAAVPANLSELDITPFFKFLKLWMLYRVATRD